MTRPTPPSPTGFVFLGVRKSDGKVAAAHTQFNHDSDYQCRNFCRRGAPSGAILTRKLPREDAAAYIGEHGWIEIGGAA